MTEHAHGMLGRWRKSSKSATTGCVEVSVTSSRVRVRDSKNPDGAVLEFTRHEWEAFLAGVSLGEFRMP